MWVDFKAREKSAVAVCQIPVWAGEIMSARLFPGSSALWERGFWTGIWAWGRYAFSFLFFLGLINFLDFSSSYLSLTVVPL